MFVTQDNPFHGYKFAKKIMAAVNGTNKHFFSKSNPVQLKRRTIVKLAIMAELKYNANALVETKYHYDKGANQGVVYAKAVQAPGLKNNASSKNHIDKLLHQIGLTGLRTVPLSQALEHKLHVILSSHHIAYRQHLPLATSKMDRVRNAAAHAKYPDFVEATYGRNLYIIHQFMIDEFGLGPVQRLLAMYPNIHQISFDKGYLTYNIKGKVYSYGQQTDEDAEVITPTYIDNLITKLSYGHATAQHPSWTGINNYLEVHAKYTNATQSNFKKNIINGAKLTITNTALRVLIKMHPALKTQGYIVCNGNSLVCDYRSAKNHDIHKDYLTSTNPKAVDLIRSLTHEVSVHSQLHSDLSNRLSDNMLTNHSRYVGFDVTLINADATVNRQPLLVMNNHMFSNRK